MKIKLFFIFLTILFSLVFITTSPIVNAQSATPSIINPSAELTIDSNWQQIKWGTNSPTFSIQKTGGFDGPSFFRVRNRSLSSGDSRWQFKNVNVKPNTSYNLSFAYRSNAFGVIMANYQDAAGNNYWDYLGDGNVQRNWSKFTTTYKTKANALNMNFFLAATGVGTYDTDSFSIAETGSATSPAVITPVTPTPTPVTPVTPVTPTPTPPAPVGPNAFNRGLVSVEFDDGWYSAYQNALPIVKKYGMTTTQYVITTPSESLYTEYMSPTQILSWKAQGQKIGSHSQTHGDLATFQPAMIQAEMANSKAYLSNLISEEVKGFVTPYCSTSSVVETIAKTLYKYSRDCDFDGNNYLIGKNNFNSYHLTSKIVEKGTTNTQIAQWCKEAKDQGKWLILVFHRIDDSATTWTVTPAEFDGYMNIVKNSGVTNLHTMAAFDEVRAQMGY